jgi:alpha-L-glutamate ligase-like protein
VFKEISYQGVPDIRTIVFKGIPVMSMLRLPTQQSDGKANLHQGAIGVGIDLALGTTKHAVWHEQIVSHHPDTGHCITDIKIPFWEKILLLSSSCQALVNLDYIGVDIVLDANLGPLVLEMNARPGLSIQIANNQGLLPALRSIENLRTIPNIAHERVKMGQEISHRLQ